MTDIVRAEAVDGMIHAYDNDNRIFQIWVDDRGEPHLGSTSTWHIPEGENVAIGHVVEVFIPIDPGHPVMHPLRVKVRHAEDG